MSAGPSLPAFSARRHALKDGHDLRETRAGALIAEKGLTKHKAYQLVSIAGNVAITQLVDKPNLGVHVRLPKSIFVKKK